MFILNFKDKQDLLLQLAESREQILSLEAKVKSLESNLESYRLSNSNSENFGTRSLPDVSSTTSSGSQNISSPNSNQNPPPLPPKSSSVKKSHRTKTPSDQVNR